MAEVKRSELDAFYYNEGIEWRKQESNVETLMSIVRQLKVSDGDLAGLSFEYGCLDQSVQESMDAVVKAVRDGGLDKAEIAILLIQLTDTLIKAINSIAVKRAFGL